VLKSIPYEFDTCSGSSAWFDTDGTGGRNTLVDERAPVSVGSPSPNIMLNYVNSTAALLGIPMDAARAERVASHLQRTVAMAALLDTANLAVHDELTEIYCPAAFQPNQFGRKQL
jgi:hypothetical protein